MKTILPLSDRFRVLSYFPGNFRRYFTGKPSCPTGTPILPISHRAPKAQLGPSPLQSNKYSNHQSPHPRRPKGQNPSQRLLDPRLLASSRSRRFDFAASPPPTLALAKRLVYHQLQIPANRHRWRLRQHDAEDLTCYSAIIFYYLC